MAEVRAASILHGLGFNKQMQVGGRAGGWGRRLLLLPPPLPARRCRPLLPATAAGHCCRSCLWRMQAGAPSAVPATRSAPALRPHRSAVHPSPTPPPRDRP